MPAEAIMSCTLVDGNIMTWGKCLEQTAFLGSPFISSIVLFAFVAFIVWRSNIPNLATLPLGLIAVVAFQLMNPEPVWQLLMIVAIIVISFLMVLTWMSKISK